MERPSDRLAILFLPLNEPGHSSAIPTPGFGPAKLSPTMEDRTASIQGPTRLGQVLARPLPSGLRKPGASRWSRSKAPSRAAWIYGPLVEVHSAMDQQRRLSFQIGT